MGTLRNKPQQCILKTDIRESDAVSLKQNIEFLNNLKIASVPLAQFSMKDNTLLKLLNSIFSQAQNRSKAFNKQHK